MNYMRIEVKRTAFEVAPWSAPPWAGSQISADESRHAMADADLAPSWDYRQLSGRRRLDAAAEDDVEEVPADEDDTAAAEQPAEEREARGAAAH